MAFYDYRENKIIPYESQECPKYPDWIQIDCGCSGGLEWGTEEPTECSRCNGSGMIWKHKKSGVLAQYPGGPFIGKDTSNDKL